MQEAESESELRRASGGDSEAFEANEPAQCDEKLPCTKCLRRNETCRPSHGPPAPGQELSPGPRPPSDPSGPVNLLHMELFHHFQHATVPTLCFAAEVWGPAVSLAIEVRAALLHGAQSGAAHENPRKSTS